MIPQTKAKRAHGGLQGCNNILGTEPTLGDKNKTTMSFYLPLIIRKLIRYKTSWQHLELSLAEKHKYCQYLFGSLEYGEEALNNGIMVISKNKNVKLILKSSSLSMNMTLK